MLMPTLAQSLRQLDEVKQKFDQLVEESKNNPNGVHLDEFSRNLMEHRKASDALWEARFASIADTGAKIRR